MNSLSKIHKVNSIVLTSNISYSSAVSFYNQNNTLFADQLIERKQVIFCDNLEIICKNELMLSCRISKESKHRVEILFEFNDEQKKAFSGVRLTIKVKNKLRKFCS